MSSNAAVLRIGPRVGVNKDTLRGWCKEAKVDAGRRPGTTTADAAGLKALRQEVKELTVDFRTSESQTSARTGSWSSRIEDSPL
jgi:transposase-like protein